MVPVQLLPLEENIGNDTEDDQRDYLLDHLELHQGERTAIVDKANTIGRYLTTIFKKSNSPREGDDANKGPMIADTCLLQLEVSVPCQCHEDVAGNQ